MSQENAETVRQSLMSRPVENGGGAPATVRELAASSRNKDLCRVELRRVVNADFLQDRLKDLAEPVASLFGLPNIDNTETLRALPCYVHQKTLDRPVGW